MRIALFVLSLACLATAGCGGDGYGCAAVVEVSPVKAYAGAYTATFTPMGASAPTETLAFTLDEHGTVTGTATVGGATESLLLGSEAGSLRNGCSIEGSLIQLSIATSDATTEDLRASRDVRGSLVGSYGATLGIATPTTGTLVVSKAG